MPEDAIRNGFVDLMTHQLPPVQAYLPNPDDITPGIHFSAGVAKNVGKHIIYARRAVVTDYDPHAHPPCMTEVRDHAGSFGEPATGVTLTDIKPGAHGWVVEHDPAVAETRDDHPEEAEEDYRETWRQEMHAASEAIAADYERKLSRLCKSPNKETEEVEDGRDNETR